MNPPQPQDDELDIVIPVKPGASDYESLRYCLRAICQHVPHRNVFLVGGKPNWAKQMAHIPVDPIPWRSKYANISFAIRMACHTSELLTDQFILFDDDMFALRPVDTIPTLHQGPIDERIAKLKRPDVPWGQAFGRTRDILRNMGVEGELYSYELHVPMVFDKNKLLELYELETKLNPSDELVHMRTLYGNYYGIGGEQVKDTKISGMDHPKHLYPDATFISTSNFAFETGLAGKYIRELFPHPCKYERQL